MMNSKAQGFTLVELLIVTMIGAVIMAAVYQTLTVQERANRHQLAIVGTEQNSRTALAVITSDLREISATDGDLLAANANSIRYRALRKAGVICEKEATGTFAYVAQIGADFTAGEWVLIFREGANDTSAEDDNWATATISSVDNSTSCAGNVIGNVDRLHFPGATLMTADTGGLIRSYTHVGYNIVDEFGRGVIYRSEETPLGNDSIAIVDGLATTANEALRFRYFNAAGTEITPSTAALRATVMRIEVKVRATAPSGMTGNNREFSDSLVTQVFLRGNNKPL